MRNLRRGGVLLVALFLGSGSVFAGFWDEGLTDGAVRTEYGPTFFDTNYGTASDPLQIDSCPFNTGCQTVFPSANAYSDWGGSTASNYWVVILNNELWHDAGNNPGVGPPNAGLPIGLPGSGQVAGLKVYPGSQRVRLSLDHRNPNPHKLGQAALPFLAFGADRDRGNGGPILTMDNDPNYFRAVGWDMKIEAANAGHAPELVDVDHVDNGLWDWPIRRSLYHPGAEFYVVDPAWVASQCSASWPWPTRHPGPGITKSYVVDVEGIFRCLSQKGYWSAPMPLSATLDGFWWIAELTGQDARVQYTVTNPRTFEVCTGCQPF